MSLYNVLKAYASYDHDVGYCQGMGFVTALLLTFMSEEVGVAISFSSFPPPSPFSSQLLSPPTLFPVGHRPTGSILAAGAADGGLRLGTHVCDGLSVAVRVLCCLQPAVCEEVPETEASFCESLTSPPCIPALVFFVTSFQAQTFIGIVLDMLCHLPLFPRIRIPPVHSFC